VSGDVAVHGARVLVRAHNLRHDYLNSFLAYAQRTADWTLGMIADRPYPHFCEGINVRRENYFLLPDTLEACDFEGDEQRTRNLRERVAACERCTGIPIHRIVLADERNSGRSYGIEFYHWPLTSAATAALRDNTMPERFALRLFASALRVIDEFEPEFVIIGGHTSTPDSFVLRLAADHLGIPVVMSRPSKILSHRCFWTPDLNMLNVGAVERCADKIAGDVSPCGEAYAHLRRFRETPATVAYIRQNWNVQAAKGFVTVTRDLADRSRRRLAWHLRGRKGPKGKPIFSKSWEIVRALYLKGRQESLFKTFTEEELAKQRYVLIALHKEPELAINFQAPFWHSQKNLIAWISMNLPCGYRLLVRDHRKNEGRRPMAFYRALLAFPGVDLISPFDAQFKYIRNADLIVADNGTTGWEGLVFGKRVISVADNFYAPTGLAVEVSDPSRLGEAIIRRLAEPEVPEAREWDRRLACLVEAEIETTVPEDESGHQTSLATVASMVSPSKRRLSESADYQLQLQG
jgi:hypothetical protein